MELKARKILTTVLIVFVFNTLNAQVFQVVFNGYQSSVSSDLQKKEFNSKSAAYVDLAGGGSFELKYYFANNFGLGVKWSYSAYLKDSESYEADLKQELGIVDDNFDLKLPPVYGSYNSQFIFSYVFDVKEKFQIEPYMGLGFKTFTTPLERAIYSINSTTYNYRKDLKMFYGFSYTPGIKFQWNINKFIGLNLFVEYDGVSLEEGSEDHIITSYNSFEKASTLKEYNAATVNVGLGLAFSFGKGLKDK